MKKQLFSTLLFACSLTTLTAQTPVYLDDTQPIEARVKDALNRMTLEEKVALCHAQSKFSSPGVPRLGIPELWMSDGPHGVRAEINWSDWPLHSINEIMQILTFILIVSILFFIDE